MRVFVNQSLGRLMRFGRNYITSVLPIIILLSILTVIILNVIARMP